MGYHRLGNGKQHIIVADQITVFHIGIASELNHASIMRINDIFFYLRFLQIPNVK